MSATLTPSSPVAAPVRWSVDASHTLVEFAVRHLMISTVKGRFAGVSGTVTTDGDDFATARVEVTIDAHSIDTREPQRDAHLMSTDFFDVARFPVLTFTSRRVERRGASDYALTGDLTIHGVTREVTLDVTAEGAVTDPWGKARAGFSARTRVNRKDFGLTWNAALETGGVLVGDEVKIAIEAELVK